MKSTGVGRSRFEQSLRASSDEIYLKTIRCMLDTNQVFDPYKDTVLGHLRSRSIGKLLDFADSLGETEYPTAAQHYAASQLAAMIKKYPFSGPIPGVDPEKKAIEVFLAAERLCGKYNLIYSLERKLGRRRSSFLRDSMRGWIRKVIGEKPDYPRIWELCSFGPGASVGVSGNATHLARKFLEPSWSVTPSALPYALAALRSDPLVWELLLKKEGSPYYCVDPLQFEEALLQRVSKVAYNKLSLVPKTAKVHRTIAVEPLLNGYVQKGIDEFLRRKLFRFGIDLKDQSRNQVLAREGSLPGPDPFATIDLSSASDLISLELARDILPPDWFELLNSTRSPAYKLGDTVTRYNKFVSMGNGFCFPLETLIFASVCVAVYEHHNRTPDFSVYGDDIIVRSSLAGEVLKGLRLIGFRHNPRKTFSKGPFRESCGADWFNGEDVRPITLDYPLESLSDLIKFHNLTLRKKNSAVLFSEVRALLRALVPPRMRYVRPHKGQIETAFEVEMDQFMASPFASYDRKTWSWKWVELVTTAISDNSLSERHGWSTVLMMAALRGSSSEAPFTKRRNTRTRVRHVSHHGGHSTWLPSPYGRFDGPKVALTIHD
jgi:hypothetical protein